MAVIEQSEKELIEKPNHYMHPSGIECKDISEEMCAHLAIAWNYLWRHQLKGESRRDLKKAARHLEYELERLRLGGKPFRGSSAVNALQVYDVVKTYPARIGEAMSLVWDAGSKDLQPKSLERALVGAIDLINEEIREKYGEGEIG